MVNKNDSPLTRHEVSLRNNEPQRQMVKPGMRLAENVYDDFGVLIAKKGIVLTERYIEIIRSRGIHSVKIRATLQALSGTVNIPTIVETEKFQTFNNAYVEKKDETEKLINSISNGGIINVDDLLKHTSAIMTQLDNKNDFITYLSFMDGTDDVTYGHSVNVSLLCNLFGQWLRMDNNDIKILTVAGMLHDVGKTQIPTEIINKKGKLTDDEFKVIKTHPLIGFEILSRRGVDRDIQYAALMHHEKINGSGYPHKLHGDKISKYASIVTICDIYDAMTSNRSYRDKICPFTIIYTFENNSYGELHTEYLLLFLKNIAHSFKNHYVKLSNGDMGEVIHINPRIISRPIIRTVNDVFIDLSKDNTISIIEVY